jgi:hypothetical protein
VDRAKKDVKYWGIRLLLAVVVAVAVVVVVIHGTCTGGHGTCTGHHGIRTAWHGTARLWHGFFLLPINIDLECKVDFCHGKKDTFG